MKDVFDEQHLALAWVDNGLGDSIGFALTFGPGHGGWRDMTLTVGNRYSFKMRAGLTPRNPHPPRPRGIEVFRAKRRVADAVW